MSVTFQPVDANSGAGNGLIKVLRGSKLITIEGENRTEAALSAGTTIEGTFSGSNPNKFYPERVDYSLRGEDGTLFIVSETASLSKQMAKVSVGELVQIVYNGKRSITRKNGAKAEMHDFQVLRAVEAAEAM